MKLFSARAPALALTKRALMLDIRSLPGASMRMTLVALMMVTVAQALATSWFQGAPGQMMFWTIAWMNALFILVLGISTFASVIAEEKEQMTLGLLRLAGFSPIAILLGKSVGALLSAVLLLAVQLPFAMLSVTLGGVSVDQVLAAYTVLGAFLLLVYAVSLLFSVTSTRTTTAAGFSAVLIVGSWIVPPIWLSLTGSSGPFGTATGVGALLWEVQELSVWSGLNRSLSIGSSFGDAQGVINAHLFAALAAFVLAWLSFNRFNQREAAAAPSRGLITTRTRGSRSRPAPGLPAFSWKAYHFDAGGVAGVWVRIIVYTLLFILIWSLTSSVGTPRSTVISAVGMAFSGFCLVLLALEFGFAASQVFHSEIKWKTLPSLAITPFPIQSWAYRKVSGFVLALMPGMAAFVLGVLLAMTSRDMLVPEMFLVGAVIFANIILGSHVAAYFSLTMRRGSFALAVVSVIAINVIWGMLMGPGSNPEGMMTMWAIILMALAAIMHHRIGQKLQEVAGQ